MEVALFCGDPPLPEATATQTDDVLEESPRAKQVEDLLSINKVGTMSFGDLLFKRHMGAGVALHTKNCGHVGLRTRGA